MARCARVACELVFVIWDHLEDKSEWRTSVTHATIPFPLRPSRIKLIVEMLSVALVVAGVVGELRIDAMLGRLETDIQDANDRRFKQKLAKLPSPLRLQKMQRHLPSMISESCRHSYLDDRYSTRSHWEDIRSDLC
jgi:hypothetical protein